MADIGLTRGPTASIGNWIGNARRGIGEELERRRLYRQTLAELHSLSDRDLSDIGVARADLRDVAQKAAYGAR